MNDEGYLKSALARTALLHAPPSVCRSLVQDAQFCREWGVALDSPWDLDGDGLAVPQKDLLGAVRRVLGGKSRARVASTNGEVLWVRDESKDGQLPLLQVGLKKKRFPLPSLTGLSPDRQVRLEFLEGCLRRFHLPVSDQESWRASFSRGPLGDDEALEFLDDLRDTPGYVRTQVRNAFESGSASAQLLVPRSRRYFERLVGKYDGSTSIKGYALEVLRPLFNELLAWDGREGLLLALLLSGHSSVPEQLEVVDLEDEQLLGAYESLTAAGDLVSRLGAVELGLRVLPARPSLESCLIIMLQGIRDADIGEDSSDFGLHWSLFKFVDGELARARVLATEPPFYRRLAAFAQSGLLHREALASNVEPGPLSQWASGRGSEDHYLQSWIDMRLEPRWNPEWSSAAQEKNEFVGRIYGAANQYRDKIDVQEIRDLVLTDNSAGILGAVEPGFLPFLPGPLEGGDVAHVDPPPAVLEAIRAQLAVNEARPTAFTAIANAAVVFRLETEIVDAAAEVLAIGRHRLTELQNESHLFTTLHGLAIVAAVTRNTRLADELRTMCRTYRRDPQFALSTGEAFTIGLVSAGSRSEVEDWTEFVGNFLTELALNELDPAEVEGFHSKMTRLLRLSPELWGALGGAEAALALLQGFGYCD